MEILIVIGGVVALILYFSLRPMSKRLFHMNAGYNRIKYVQYYIDRGIDINIKEPKHGLSPLHFAASNGALDTAELLINNNANVNSFDYNGSTPLHFAALNGYDNIIKLLIDSGSNVNIQDYSGCTPLHYAASTKNKRILDLLCMYGGNLHIEANDRKTPLDVAKENGIN